MTPYIIEACVESIQEAITAQKNGAHQIELCRALHLDGLTPELSTITEVISELDIPVKVMVRPKPGDFVYNQEEVKQMRDAILAIKELPIAGIVLGALTNESLLDIPLIKTLVSIATPINVTIHKAIDQSKDPLSDLKRLNNMKGIEAVLTSGKASTALEGKHLLKKMIHHAPEEIEVIVAGKITRENLSLVHTEIGATAYHGREIVGQLF
ncbi:MAG: copper homeostasis protein CutC [Cyclobacteriaceae bacterium]